MAYAFLLRIANPDGIPAEPTLIHRGTLCFDQDSFKSLVSCRVFTALIYVDDTVVNFIKKDLKVFFFVVPIDIPCASANGFSRKIVVPLANEVLLNIWIGI